MERPFAQGLRDGLPVACAYLAVSFGFGIMCRSAGLGTLAATLISGLNLTSAGQAAGLAVIRAGGTLIEMAKDGTMEEIAQKYVDKGLVIDSLCLLD